jgi:putative tryptophan/tyrosine transport system substrate-binding protein
LRRRDFITGMAGSAAAWPLAAHAQQSVPIIGFLNSASPEPFAPYVRAFLQGLEQFGFIDGKTVVIDYRWSRGQDGQLAEAARDLANRPVEVIVATGGEHAARAAKAVTSNVPIIFSVGGDPVKLGLVSSLNRPGGNLTGVAVLTADLEAKRLGLLSELLPNAQILGALVDANYASADSQYAKLQAAVRELGKRILVLKASNDGEIEGAFGTLSEQKIAGLLVASSVFFNARRNNITSLAARTRTPAVYQWREFPMAGGLMSYGPSLVDMYRQVGVYTGRVLRGVRTVDLPVFQPSNFEFVINLKTAKALGIALPPTLLALAEEVLE